MAPRRNGRTSAEALHCGALSPVPLGSDRIPTIAPPPTAVLPIAEPEEVLDEAIFSIVARWQHTSKGQAVPQYPLPAPWVAAVSGVVYPFIDERTQPSSFGLRDVFALSRAGAEASVRAVAIEDRPEPARANQGRSPCAAGCAFSRNAHPRSQPDLQPA